MSRISLTINSVSIILKVIIIGFILYIVLDYLISQSNVWGIIIPKWLEYIVIIIINMISITNIFIGCYKINKIIHAKRNRLIIVAVESAFILFSLAIILYSLWLAPLIIMELSGFKIGI